MQSIVFYIIIKDLTGSENRKIRASETQVPEDGTDQLQIHNKE